MANERHVTILIRDGVAIWNLWRKHEPTIRPDLSGADLKGADLKGADLSGADLSEAHLSDVDLGGANLSGVDLTWAHFRGVDLTEADLNKAILRGADLSGAHLRGAHLRGAHLFGAHLSGADLTGADLTGADLSRATCLRTRFCGATLKRCSVYGISAWDLDLEGAVQADLRITPADDESAITVDNLEVAQFLYVLLHNQRVRAMLDTISSKVVLILGRFEERKPHLDALREALRHHPNGYIPVLFDFEPQHDKPVLETVKILANLARFIIADLTDPHMVRAELTAIIPNVPAVPVQPIIQAGENLPTEYASWKEYKSFLPIYRYADVPQLLAGLAETVIAPVEAHVQARRLTDADLT